ncbi:MAG TPA: lipopolysaccharide biosynthesis protein [Gemmatimonadales bacterium]|nr:lipopolysaccharide biosynthesis protein [Gemmatimonadales bacterium]
MPAEPGVEPLLRHVRGRLAGPDVRRVTDSEVIPSGSSLGGIGRRRDYVLTFAAEFAALGSSLLVLKLAAAYWGTTGFGEYMLVRRSLGFLYLPILCGMGLAVTRHVAMARARGERTEQSYFLGAVLVTAATSGAAAVLLNVLSRPLAVLIFSSGDYAMLVRALAVAVPGLAFHGVAYGMFRGRMAMLQANALQVVNLAVVPAAVFSLPGLSVAQVTTLMGLVWSGVSVCAIGGVLQGAPHAVWKRDGLAAHARELLQYGVARIPGELALGALLALPVLLAAHSSGVERAGFVGLGVSLLSMLGSLFAPLGQILLPAVSSMWVQDDHMALWRKIRTLALRCLGLAVILVAVVEGLAPWGLVTFLGPEFGAAVPVVRTLCLALIPFVAYVVLRNVLDALHARPLNAKNLVLALGIFLAGASLGASPRVVVNAFAIGMLALGLLTIRDVRLAFLTGRDR